MKNLYTIILSFSDHLKGIGQYEAEDALGALKEFIETNESLDTYNRVQIKRSIMPLIHYVDNKGLWTFHFNPEFNLNNEEDNPILGGSIIQTDPSAPSGTPRE